MIKKGQKRERKILRLCGELVKSRLEFRRRSGGQRWCEVMCVGTGGFGGGVRLTGADRTRGYMFYTFLAPRLCIPGRLPKEGLVHRNGVARRSSAVASVSGDFWGKESRHELESAWPISWSLLGRIAQEGLMGELREYYLASQLSPD